MTQLAASGLETADYNMPHWIQMYNSNVKKLNDRLLKVRGLLDVNADDLRDGAVIFWFASHSLWKTREVKL